MGNFHVVGEPGGIVGLSRIAVEHRAELAADFRSIYSVSLWDVRGAEMWFLIRLLLANPASRFHAAVAKWEHPITFEAMYQLDLIDVLLMRWAGDKFKPVARPWDKKPAGSKKTMLSAAEAHKRLRPHLYKD